jgi:CelD/BcsL family acetyltransferase involved in cellulose biosynthesis
MELLESPSRQAPAGERPLTLACELATTTAEAERLRAEWTELLERSERNELTLTPEWLLTWQRVYGPQQGRRLRIALFHDSGRLVGLAPLLLRRHWVRGVVPFRRLEFLASGEREGHGVCSNHLNVIAERGAEEPVARRLVVALTDGTFGAWDEVVLPMMDGDGPMPALLATAFREAGLSVETTETARAPYISLPKTWETYLKSLSSTHRRQVTRSLRAFEEWADGAARLDRVTDAAELEQAKRVLVELHHARWEGDGQSGVFHSPSFLQFHDAIMRTLLERGSLELLRLSVRGEPVAALYGMTWGDKTIAYQTGRSLNVPNSIRPGGVILAYAVRAAIEAGRREFDFLADEAPYKLQMATASRPLVQLRAHRAGPRETMRRLMERCFDGARMIRKRLLQVCHGRLGRADGAKAKHG